ncbi:MAG: SurA N-terminal domain-containing protein [Gammaproteobacteria bacterium]|nr:SurA N-terminal domain-containing protein [Gammaproteobacteria bacterium]
MLSEIRDRATGWIAYVIVGIIIIPFAFWGVNEYFAGGEDVVVATVGDAEIQQVDYRRELDNRRAQMRRMLGEDFQPELANSPEFKRGVLEDLITRRLLDQHADDQGYRVGDELLAERIRSNPRFQMNEQFSSDAYRSSVAQMGLSEAGFEAAFRRQIMLEQITAGIQESAFVSPQQRDRLLELLLQERRFDYAVLESADFIPGIEVSDAEIRTEYEENTDRYRTPERVKLQYVELSVDQLASSISIDEADIQQAYEREQDRFTTDPVRHASHILIETRSDAGEEERREALEEARDLLAQIRDGADFAALAREHSDDPGSASKGGDLGRIQPGSMVEPFEEALFELDSEGAVTDPVRTRFGYHLIKLTEYEPAEIKPLEEVREQLVREERTRQAEAQFLDQAETFRNISYEQPQSLEPVAGQLDLDIESTDWFTRNQGSGIAADPKVREAAFSEDVYSEGLNSEAIELDINSLVVVRVLDKEPASVRPLDDVRADIEARLERRKAQQHVTSLGPEIAGELRSGSTWRSIVEEYGLSVETTTWSRSRTSETDGPHPALVDAVFGAPKPSGDEPVPGGVALGDGNYALFRLIEVTEGDVNEASEELQQRVDETLFRRRSQDMLEQLITDLREQADVNIKEQAL